MPQDTSAYDVVLKTVYEGGIRELIPTKVRTLEKFQEKDSKSWGGRFVEYPARVGRNQGSGWGTELGNLPTAGRQKYTNVRIPMRYQYGRILLSAQVMKASEGSKNAFASAMEQEMQGLIKDMTSQRGRAILGDGRGIMALAGATPTASATVAINSPGGFTSVTTNGGRYINPGDVIGFINPTTGTLRAANITVQSVAANGATLVANAAPTTGAAANDFMVKVMQAGSTDVSDTSFQKEPMGLMGLIDDGTFVPTLHNVNRTTYPIYQSTVIGAVSALSADVLQRGIDLADQRGDGEISDLIMHHSVRRQYLAMMEQDRRYISGDLSRPDAGTVAAKRGKLAFGGIEITEEKYCPYGTVFGVDASGFSRYVEVAGEWADEDGAVLSRVGPGTTSAQDAFEAFYRIWDNFHNDFPARCFRLDGVTATIVVAHID